MIILRPVQLLICFGIASTWAHHSLDSIFDKLESEVNPYQITVFQADSSDRHNHDLFHRAIAHLPKAKSSLDKMDFDKKEISDTMLAIFKNPRAARVVNLILQDAPNLSEVGNALDNFVKFAPIPSRPKCILVIFENDSTHESYYLQVFEHAWSLYFLEFLILQLNSSGEHRIINYDPFTRELTHEFLDFEGKLFRDKLRNMHRYPFKLPFGHFPPYSIISRDNETREKTITGYYYKPIQTFVTFTNSSVIYVDFDPLKYSKMLAYGLEHNEISFAIHAFGAASLIHGNAVEFSKVVTDTGLVFAVPLISYSLLNFPSDLFVNLLCMLIIMLCFKFTMKLLIMVPAIDVEKLGVDVKDWSITEIFQMFMGVSVDRSFASWPERFVALSVLFLSMFYSSELIANLTDVKLLKTEVPFETLDDVYRSGLPIQAASLFEYTLRNQTSVDWLNERLEIVSRIKNCFEANQHGKPTICIDAKHYSIFHISRYRDLQTNQSIMKLMEPMLYGDFNAYPFEKASPYVDKFNDMLTRLSEAGLIGYWLLEPKKKRLELNEKLFNESSILTVLLIILFSGTGLSFLLFSCELLYNGYVHKRGNV